MASNDALLPAGGHPGYLGSLRRMRMTVITEFTIPAEAFALDRTLEAVPEVTIEVERHATHSREWIMPFLWTTGADPATLEEAFRADPTVDAVTRLDQAGDVGQFTVEWADDVQELVDDIVDRQGVIQEAEAANGLWYLKLKFVDQDAVREFQTYFEEHGYTFELERLYDGTALREREYDLTPEQRTALVTALELGYFAVPREIQIGELAAELGISTSAVSQRLRRATRNLTENTLTLTPSDALTGNE